MKIIGIETSCDETGIALYDTDKGLLSDALYSQVDMHALYGGIVPELASRDHVKRCKPLLDKVLSESNLKLSDVDGIAYTHGPGLVGALMVGAAFAKGLALALNVPIIGVHHMEGHLLAPMLEENKPEFPFLALLVSGGHTQLVQVNALGEYHILGDTVDDAAGEAFDKTAKLMGLPYPGGPRLAQLAESGREGVYLFPRPMVNRPGCDFSFSGLKTFVRNTYEASDKSAQTKADIALAFELAFVDTMRIKITRAMEQTGLKRLVLAGGVSANQRLRLRLAELSVEKGWEIFYPRPAFCTDNGAMIALAGAMRLLRGEQTPMAAKVVARWPLSELSAVKTQSN